MLTAFNARSIRELGPKDRSRQECIHAYNDKLLVGLNNGTLRIYRVSDPGILATASTLPPPIKIECLRELENFTKKSIAQIDGIVEASVIVVLADNYVTTYDMQTYEKTEQISKTKGATLFAVTTGVERDPSGIASLVSKLAVVVKRRVLLYTWVAGQMQEAGEIPLPAQPKCLIWATEEKLCAGSSSHFSLIDVKTEAVQEITAMASNAGGYASTATGYLAWATKLPMAIKTGDDEMLLVRDSTSIYVTTSGEAISTKPPLEWTHAPESIGYSYPFLISHQPKSIVEIRNAQSQNLLQTISLPTLTMIHTPSHAATKAEAAKQFYVASPTQIWKMVPVNYADQVKELITKGEYDEAISLLEQLDITVLGSKHTNIKDIQMLKAERFFEDGKYRASMDLFAEVSAPPARVIRLFPPVIAGELSRFSVHENGHTKDEDVPDTASAVTYEDAPDVHQNGSIPDKSHHDDALNGLKVDGKAKKGSSDTASVRSERHDADIIKAASSLLIAQKEKPKPLEGSAFNTAVNELSSYLADIRRRLQKFVKPDMDFQAAAHKREKVSTFGEDDTAGEFIDDISEVSALLPMSEEKSDNHVKQLEQLYDIATLVDTTLLRAYMLTKTGLVKSLVRLTNFCEPKVVHEKLLQSGMFKELVDYLMTKRIHRDALVLLKDLGDQPEADEREPDLHGPRPTVAYLKKLNADQLPLIFEFLGWVLKTDPKLGMEVFTEDTAQAESLPRSEVREYLETIDVRLALEYTQHVVEELHDESPEFHNALIKFYLDLMVQEKDDVEEGEEGEKGEKGEKGEEGEGKEWKWKLEKGERHEMGERLLAFLEQSSQYWPERVQKWLPQDDPDFYEARAAILGKQDKHREALEIYVFKLEDHKKAENYCNRIHLSDPPDSDPAEIKTETVYHILLSLYLAPPPPNPVQLTPALGLLSRHGARLDPSDTLKLIPDSLKITELESYFQNRIRHANSRMNMNRIMANLRKVDLVTWEEKLMDAKNGSVKVGKERVCPVCHKRLGRSVISVFPDGQVVHYGCGAKLTGESRRGTVAS